MPKRKAATRQRARTIRHAFKRRKYNAKPTYVDGIRFDSKREANRYVELKLLREAGEVVFFLRQVPFHLPGRSRCVVDFLVFWADDHVSVEDTKGVQTEVFKLKKRQVEEIYPVEIELL